MPIRLRSKPFARNRVASIVVAWPVVFPAGARRHVVKENPLTKGRAGMTIQVQRTEFDEQLGYQYYVAFNSNGTFEEDEVHDRVPVEVALSLCENGDLADFSCEVPMLCR